MNFETLQIFLFNHEILGNISVFIIILITNIFPLMFFILPEFAIFLWIFISKKITIWYISYTLLILWALIWEFISYYIGYKYGYKILENKFLQNNFIKNWLYKLKKHPIKMIIIWKTTPWITWVIPILSWMLKINFIKFTIFNFIMVIISISSIFFIWLLWISFLEQFSWEYIWYISFTILIIYIIYHIYKIKKNNWIQN